MFLRSYLAKYFSQYSLVPVLRVAPQCAGDNPVLLLLGVRGPAGAGRHAGQEMRRQVAGHNRSDGQLAVVTVVACWSFLGECSSFYFQCGVTENYYYSTS